MTKQELIAHFQEQKKIIEREIVFWQAQPDAEAEKPKIGHGDFGITNAGHYRIFLSKCVEGFDWSKPVGGHQEYSEIGVIGDENFTFLGNIFDLLKEWSEDLKEAYAEDEASGIKIEGENIEIYFCTGADCAKKDDYCRYKLSEAEEIWHKLGQMIATLKRKQS